MHNDRNFPPAIVKVHVEQLFEQAAVALHNAERCGAESLEWYCKLGKTLLQGQEAHGVYGWKNSTMLPPCYPVVCGLIWRGATWRNRSPNARRRLPRRKG